MGLSEVIKGVIKFWTHTDYLCLRILF